MTSIAIGDWNDPILQPIDGDRTSEDDQEASGTGDSTGETTSDGEPLPDCGPTEFVNEDGECEPRVNVILPPPSPSDPEEDVGAERQVSEPEFAALNGDVPVLAIAALAVGLVLWITAS